MLILFKKNSAIFLAKNIFCFAISFLLITKTSAQTTNISGIVNTYHKVVEIIPSKACIRVANISGLNVNKLVMLVQMKGASVNTTNSASFGDTLSLNNAGNYEIGTVCYIIGDSVFLFHNLLNDYTPSTGSVQLVQFAEYYSADVIDTVKTAKWDSATGTGGVIAIFANQNITLNAPIYADSSGYLGGNNIVSNGTCLNFPSASSYYYNASSTAPQNGAYKGESIANLTTAQSGGRGAPANGGGGGNNHNNSGGGGANLNGGGIGGGNSSTAGCTTTLQGLAGKALSSWTGTKIFMGGGGGAGHANYSLNTSFGGNGGGIVFIWANNIIGNGYEISADGGNGGTSLSDGAGGAGAGGTIIMNVSTYTGSVNIKVSGGDGGLSNNDATANRCYGGGGGGSGGEIYFSSTVPAVTIAANGGSAGVEINRAGSCSPPVAATAGSNGQIISNYTFFRSTDPAGYCQVLLPIKLVMFNAIVIEKKILLKWQIQNPTSVKQFIIERSPTTSNWEQLQAIPGNDDVNIFSAIDVNPIPGESYYRIKFLEKDNSISYSPLRKVITEQTEEFRIYPNPAANKIFISGKNNIATEITCIDLSGKIVFRKHIATIPSSIDLSFLSNGIYFLKINHTFHKLVVQK